MKDFVELERGMTRLCARMNQSLQGSHMVMGAKASELFEPWQYTDTDKLADKQAYVCLF